jgi:hypothetical protein
MFDDPVGDMVGLRLGSFRQAHPNGHEVIRAILTRICGLPWAWGGVALVGPYTTVSGA